MANLVSLTPGQIFAKDFRAQKLLAEGGMGAVYVVEQLSTGKLRALKLMHPRFVADPRSRARFIQEARVASKIESDHVVEVVSAGVDDATDTPWLAMELLRGETLAEVMERRRSLPASEVHEIFRQFGHALAAAHDVALVHRDLKPENLFLATARRPDVAFMVKILDFGIAKFVGEASAATQSATASVGSPLWMAPEQAGTGGVSPVTDVWALGLLAFYMLTGRYFWVAANVEGVPLAGLLAEILVEPLASATDRAVRWGCAGALPPNFDAWFERCVVRDGSRRFANAREAIAPLLAVLSNWHDGTAATLVSSGRIAAEALNTPGRLASGDAWVHARGTPAPGHTTDPNPAATRASLSAGHGVGPTQPHQLSAPPSGPVMPYPSRAAPPASRNNPLVVTIAVALIAGIIAGSIMVVRLLMPADEDAPHGRAHLIDNTGLVPLVPMAPATLPPPGEPVPAVAPATTPLAPRAAHSAPRINTAASTAHPSEPSPATGRPIAAPIVPPEAPPPVIPNARSAGPGPVAANPGSTGTANVSAGSALAATAPSPNQPVAPPPVRNTAPAAPSPMTASAPVTNPVATGSSVTLRPVAPPAALVAEARRAIAQYSEECWAAAQRRDPNHPAETIRIYLSMGLIGRAYDVHFAGARDHVLGICIVAALGRHSFTVSPMLFDTSAEVALTPDHPTP